MKMKVFYLSLISILSLAIMHACSKNEQDSPNPTPTPEPSPSITAIQIAPNTLDLNLGDSSTLSVSHTPANLTAPTYEWSTTDATIASVANGKVKALKVGEATIGVQVNSTTLKSEIRVKVLPIGATHIDLASSNNTISIGEKTRITYEILPANTTDKENMIIEWTSDKMNIATVDNTGEVTAVSLGTAVITARIKDTNISNTFSIHVKAIDVQSVSLNQTSGSLNVGGTVTLQATVLPADATNKQVSWSSSNNNIATVNSAGVVTAVASGTTTITATTEDGNKTATYNLTVSPIAVSSVSIPSTSGSLVVGATFTLNAAVLPANASNKSLTYTSSNTNIATVTSTGVITAKAAGTAIITVKSVDGNKTATYTVTVTDIEIDSILISINNDNIEIGQTSQPTVVILPQTATNRNLTWTSSNPSVASINQSTGLITGVAPGSTTITVRTSNGKTSSKIITVKSISISFLNLNVSRLDIMVGDNFKLIATPTPSNASTSNLHWESSVPTVATVDQQGNVTAVANGTTTIRVSTAPGSNVNRQIVVSVQNAQNTFKLVQTKGIIELAGNRTDLNCTLSLNNPTPESITYTGFVVKDANNNIKSTVNANMSVNSGGGIGFSYLLTNFNGTYTMYVKVIYRGTTYELPIELKRGN